MTITGRITRDAEVHTLGNEKQVVNFSIATNDSYKNKQGERVQLTTFFNCAYWLSAKVAKLLTKGVLVELTGRVSTNAWEAKDGSLKAGLNFHTSQIKIHSFTKTAETLDTPDTEKGNKNHEDIPF